MSLRRAHLDRNVYGFLFKDTRHMFPFHFLASSHGFPVAAAFHAALPGVSGHCWVGHNEIVKLCKKESPYKEYPTGIMGDADWTLR
jgi:hypothetical protein